MIQNSQYRAIPTDKQLNGPILSFTTTPSDQIVSVGQSAFFTGIATAQFPSQTPVNPAVGFATGSIVYQWYEATLGELSDGIKYTGTATTQLYVNDSASPDDNGKQYYLSANYVAIGTSPNAVNDTFTSSRANLTVYPEIIINTQPSDATVGAGGDTTFTIDASLTDGSYGGIAYQWRIDGENITDGIYESVSAAKEGIKGQIDDAVLLVPMDEDPDSSGNVNFRDYSNNTKTITPGSTYGDAPVWQNTGFATGNFYNGAAYFNGSTSYINVSGSSDFRMTDQPFTMEAWIKWSDNSWSSTWEVMACIGGGYYSDGGIWWAILRKDATGSDTTFYISHSGGYSAIANNIDIKADDNEWHHFAVTRTSSNDGHLIRMWMDGEKIGENSVNFVNKNFGGGALGYIGLEHATFHTIGYYYPNCWMQDFRCYKGLDKYKEAFTPSTISIRGYSRNVSIFNDSFPASLALPLWNSTGTINEVNVEDRSENKLTITPSDIRLTWDTNVKKWYDGSAFFPNDSDAYLSVESSEVLAFETGDFTIEAWCYFTKDSWSDIFSTDNYSLTFEKSEGLFAFRKSSTNILSFYCNTNFESMNNGVTNGDPIPQNTWVHCAVTRQNGVVRMFLNGNFQDSHDFGESIPSHSAGQPRVGGAAGNTYPMGGYIQDLIVYKGVAKYTEDFVVPNRSILSEDKTYSEISGSQTAELTITPDTIGANKIDCVVTHPDADTKTSNTADLVITEPKSLINIEGYDSTSTASLLNKNLEDSDFSLSASDVNSDDICLYAAEKDIDVEFDLFAAKGSDRGGFVGGEGGYSRIVFTMKHKEEYILRGLKSNTGLFLYRKGSLIAAVGSGGDAGTTGNGGKGGGINLSGESGTGGNAGAGGPRIGIGNLLEDGTYGSASSLAISDIYPEDGKSTGTFGGTTIKCSKGKYWRDQGKSACEDLGRIKFRLSDGTEVTNSAEIDRGFKSGYSINRTAGAHESGAGFGGDGAVGGDGGGTGKGGGGGGSGYSDGSINISINQVGGSTSNTRINIRLNKGLGGFYTDDQGRILIMSCTDIRDPNTLEITTGKILPGDNKVLDDIRWQRFLDLARDGTENYRITATLNNSTVKLSNATEKNIHRMINANRMPIKNSMARGWVDMGATYNMYAGRKALAWDETSGSSITGVDYSMLWWVSGSGWGYYGWSSNPFFAPTIYYQKSANYWILPPGVPDFS